MLHFNTIAICSGALSNFRSTNYHKYFFFIEMNRVCVLRTGRDDFLLFYQERSSIDLNVNHYSIIYLSSRITRDYQ